MEAAKQERLLSLDVFRGITIAGMILVNNPGSWSAIYPPLKHAAWHGLTPTDLIFPFFLFIVGVAITISLTRRKEQGSDINKLILQIVRRGGMLFLLGLILSTFPFYNFTEWHWIDLGKVRIPGVLQRIGVVYIIASIIFLKSSIKTQAIIGTALLLVYWFLMTLIPVPGVGYANLEPATNFAAYIDNLLLSGHMWSATKVWDPEGVLSTIPAISTAISGMMLGHWMRTKHTPELKTIWIMAAGNFALVTGYLWDLAFPMNKSIWTSSYVVFTSGMALQFFGMCYWLVDVKGYKWWTKPFIVYGMNAITVFFVSGLVGRMMNIIHVGGPDGKSIALKTWLYESLFTPYFSPINASLAWALCYVLAWLGVMWILYEKKIFIKV